MSTGSGCVDSPYFSDCNLIIQNRYCNNLMYAKFCCQSCLLAGQLDETGVAAAIRGTRSVISRLSRIPKSSSTIVSKTNTANKWERKVDEKFIWKINKRSEQTLLPLQSLTPETVTIKSFVTKISRARSTCPHFAHAFNLSPLREVRFF